MSHPIILKKPLVRIDLAGCYAHIWERSPDAANRFRQAAEATFAALAKSPGIGEPYKVTNPRLEDLRCTNLRRFKNYLIFYRPIPGGIDVIRVLRRPQHPRDLGSRRHRVVFQVTIMKTIAIEDVTLDRCIAEAQQEKVILTRNGHPIALVTSVDGMDEEQIRLSSDPEFWKLFEVSRKKKTISREDLDRRLAQLP